MTSLNIQSISEVESVATLWEVLASMRKLRHLAMNEPLLSPESPLDGHSLSSIRSSVRKMSLTAFETSNTSGVLQLDILLPALYWLKHLRISGYVPRLTNILPSTPHLTHLALSNDYYGDVPTDPLCYPSIKQIYIFKQDVSEEFVQALAHSGSLTHMYILEAKFVSTYLQLKDFPHLMSVLCVNTQRTPPEQLCLDAHGICGFVKPKKRSELVDPDVKSLWITCDWI